jgi:solute carrier family 41
MTSINELVAIVLAILNLKGNIEMNLSARLGTAANMGDLDVPSVRNTLILGNLALIQVQAATVSFIAACIAFLLSTIFPGAGEELPASLSTETRNIFHYSRTPSLGHSHRGPRPVLPPVGASKSGFNEYVSCLVLSLPTSPFLLGSLSSHQPRCLLPASLRLSSAHSCQAS